MAQRKIVELIDDLNGKRADESLTFGLDGHMYEIDLSAANAAKLRRDLARFIVAGRPAGNARAAGAKPFKGESDAAVIREWAIANGYQVSKRGRISTDIREAYLAA